MKKLSVTVLGQPVPYTRMLRGQKKTKQAVRYLAWKKAAAWCVLAEAKGDVMETPVRIGVQVYHVAYRGDISNFHKGCEDACVDAGVIPDDSPRYVPGILPCDFHIDKENPRIEVLIESV